MHVGTFTPEGTYAAAEAKLPYLKDLGITAIELLPLADFPGRWNWGNSSSFIILTLFRIRWSCLLCTSSLLWIS